MKTIVVENTRPALIGIAVPGEKGEGSVGKHLSPGENDVPVSLWKRYKETPVGKMLIESRYLKERPDIEKATPLVENLKEVELEKAVALVEGCKSEQLLKIWANNDRRSKVQAAISRRLTAFAVPKDEAEVSKPASKTEEPRRAASGG